MSELAFVPGQELSGFSIVRPIGSGGYGSIYQATVVDSGSPCALKVEPAKRRKNTLKCERDVLRELQGCPYSPRLLGYGHCADCRFLALELLGPSTCAIRHARRWRRLSLSTTLRIGIEAIRALRELHTRGIIHRDVKPANLVVRPSRRRPICLIDYGLARQFADPATGEVAVRRIHPGFSGTPRYASVAAIRGREVGPRDDIMSLLFSLVELRTGKLPWRWAGAHRAYGLGLRLKHIPRGLFAKMPRQFKAMYEIASKCALFELPDYDLLTAFLVQAMTENKCSFDDPFDWETMGEKQLKKLTTISMRIPDAEMHADVPNNLPEPVVPDRECEEISEAEDEDVQPELPRFEGGLIMVFG